MPRYCHFCGKEITDGDPLHCSMECARKANAETEHMTAEEERAYYGLDRPH